jgi:hypothetical protein
MRKLLKGYVIISTEDTSNMAIYENRGGWTTLL